MIRKSLFALVASLMTLSAFSGTVGIMTIGNDPAVPVACPAPSSGDTAIAAPPATDPASGPGRSLLLEGAAR